jgi:hypothetical protein
MEEVMSSSKTILQTVTATAIFAALAINAAHAGDNAHFRTMLKRSGHIQHAQVPRHVARTRARTQGQWGGWESWGSSSSSSFASNLDDEVRHIDGMNQMFHDDAVNNAAAETNAANAAAAQAQNDLINATAPVGPQ